MSTRRSHMLALNLLALLLIDSSSGWVFSTKSSLSNRQSRQKALLSTNGLQGKSPTRTDMIHSTTTTILQASKFSQPAFSQPAFSGNATAKKSSPPQRDHRAPVVRKYGSDSKIASMHAERIRTAGRVGTKRYVDPCKVFFGNLPFTLTEKVLEAWIAEQMGTPAPLLLSQVKVIRDWKTSKSKGYGFAVFTEPIHATVCIDKCNNRLLEGRALSVNQGKKKESTQIYVKKKKTQPLDADEAIIQAGMEEASKPRMDPREAMMLRHLDPDLVDDDFNIDEGLFDEDEDDDEVDGFYFEEEDDYVPTSEEALMNRKQRRDLAKQRKKRKPVNKGFGT